jgi:hypothetical protein
MTARPVPEWDDTPDPQPARPLIDVDDVDLILEALGHYAGSLLDSGRSPATVDRAARLQGRLDRNRDTLAHLFAGVAPALSMTEEV